MCCIVQVPDGSQEDEMVKVSSDQEKSVSASAEGQKTDDQNKVIDVIAKLC